MKQVNITIVSLLTFFLLATIGGCKESTKQTGGNECTETTNSPNMPFVITLSVANQAGIPTTTFTQGEPISFTAALTNISQQPQWVWLTMCAPFPVTINITNTLGNTVTDVNSDISPCCEPPTWNPTNPLYFSIPAGGYLLCKRGSSSKGHNNYNQVIIALLDLF
jgi:hypothetical protein